MIQTLYGILAMMMLALLTLTMNRTIHENQMDMMVNEISAQVTNIADEFFDQMAVLPYDAATISGQLIVDRSALMEESEFGAAVCNPDNRFSNCEVMNDLHGKSVTRTVDGFTYQVDVSLEYVEEDDPDTPSSTPTFSKRATVTVTSQDLYLASSPLQITLTRLFSYPRVTG